MYLGHDAEFVILNKRGKAVPAHVFFPPKDDAVDTEFCKNNMWAKGVHHDQIFRDGTNLEVNTPGNVSCIATLLNSTKKSLQVANRRLPKGYKIDARSAYEINMPKGGVPADVAESGCSPVKNAYDGWDDQALYFDIGQKTRFAGGHIHFNPGKKMEGSELFGTEKKRIEHSPVIVKLLDALLAVPILYLGLEGDAGVKRRTVFGRAGEFRCQEYKVFPVKPAWDKKYNLSVVVSKTADIYPGLEYRVLGPEWLRDKTVAYLTLKMARNVFNHASSAAIRVGLGGGIGDTISKGLLDVGFQEAVREAINSGEVEDVYWDRRIQGGLMTVAGVPHKTLELIKIAGPKLARVLTLHKDTAEMHQTWPQTKKKITKMAERVIG